MNMCSCSFSVPLLALMLQVVLSFSANFLAVDKATQTFTFNGQRVFLSGGNQPWIDYGNDFGNSQSNGKKCELQEYIANLTAAGGNTMRIWLFIEGDSIPSFNSSGFVIATDGTGTLIDDLRVYVQYAAAHNVFVNLCLWNGAVLRNQNAIDLFSSSAKLDAFIDNALVPIVKALADEPGVGSWEVINEPEGSLSLTKDDKQPCYDTKTVLENTGAGWAGHSFTMHQLLIFVNKQAAAIHRADPKALVTVGSWSPWVLSDVLAPDESKGFRNYYKDSCLVQAGGEADGVLDFYQVHAYPDKVPGTVPGGPHNVFASNASIYALDKPLVIGEFAHTKCASAGCTASSLYAWAYGSGYQGAWDWAMNHWATSSQDGEEDLLLGLESLQGKPYVAVDIGGIAPTDTCSCSDVAPAGPYTCAQQAGWGKCNEDFMAGFCCRSCHACKDCSPGPTPTPTPAPTPAPSCKDMPPAGNNYTCAEQKAWGKCDTKANPWMVGYCCQSCFDCAPGCGAAPTPSCDDIPPAGNDYTCAEQKSWGKCDTKANPWMAGYCCKSCFNCDPSCGKAESLR